MVKIGSYTLAAVGLLVLLLIGTGSWLLYSTAGTRWALTHLPGWGGIDLRIGRVEGTIAGSLQLEEVELNQAGLKVRLDHLATNNRVDRWFPLSLDLRQTHLAGLHITTEADQPAETAADSAAPATALQWPQMPRSLGILRIELSEFELRDFSWQQAERDPVRIELLRGDFHWRSGGLQASSIVMQNADFRGRGSFGVDLAQQMLQVDAQIEARAETSSWRQLQLKTDLQASGGGNLLRGPVALDLVGSETMRLTVAFELEMRPEQLAFRQLRLSRPNRPGQITGDGSLQFGGEAPELAAELQLSGLDLQEATGQPLLLFGSLQAKGWLTGYTGRFELDNQMAGLADASLAADFNGDMQQVELSNLRGEWLAGKLSGHAGASWHDGWQVRTQLTGQDIDPQHIQPQLEGLLNLELQADFSGTERGLSQGRLQLELHDSIWYDQPLTGEALLQLQDDTLQVTQLKLRSEGVMLQASGDPAEKLAIRWQIERLEQLLPDAAGRFSGQGWLSWRDQRLATDFTAEGEQLTFRQWHLGSLRLQGATDDAGEAWRMQLTGQTLRSSDAALALEQIEVGLQGSLEDHNVTLSLAQQENLLRASFRGGWQERQWAGAMTALQIEAPRLGTWRLQEAAPLVASPHLLSIDPLQLRGATGGELHVQARYQPELKQGQGRLRWQALDLSLLQPWLADWQIAGQSSGSLELEQGETNRLQAELTVMGELERQQLQLQLSHSELSLDWDQTGLQSFLQMQLADGSSLSGTLTSPEAARFSWPPQGRLQLTGDGFSLQNLQLWAPSDLNAVGQLDWQLVADWQRNQPLRIEGEAIVGEAELSWQGQDGIISAEVSSAGLSWQWQNRLQGLLELQLSEQGSIKADFDLPLAASLPLVPAPTGSVRADLQARLRERGLLSALMPGLIQESRGQLELNLRLAGSWQKPELQGDYHLYDSGAFLPMLGIELKEIELQGVFAENRLEVGRLQLNSGGGRLSGSGRIELQNWLPGSYQMELEGENFQLINLPDLQVRANPDLMIEGRGPRLSVRGQIELPRVLIRGKQKTGLARNSPDLVVVDREEPPARQTRLQHDVDVNVILGEQVLLDTAGIDARLAGRIRLQSTDEQDLVANGAFHVVKGRYASYGVNLDIERGNLYFTGGPLDQPTLDILALRQAGDVKAGVKVIGTPKNPVVQLYSEPAMPETDILSYIVLGRPVGAGTGETDLLMAAASALLSQGESVTLQEKLKDRLGLDVFDISAGSGDVTSSIVTTGKYLTPDLYISLGYSLFENTSELNIRYSLTPTWEIESNFGVESGVDMYYRIEFE